MSSNVDKGLIYSPNLIRIICNLFPFIVDTIHFCVSMSLLLSEPMPMVPFQFTH